MASILTDRTSTGAPGGVPVNDLLNALGALDATPGLLYQTDADSVTKRTIGVGAAEDIPSRADVDARLSLVKQTVAAVQALTTATFTGGYLYLVGYYAPADYADNVAKGGGWFAYDSTDVVTADDGATVLVDASSRRWKLQQGSRVTLSQCGGKVDNSADDLAALNRGIGLINAGTIDELVLDAGDIRISDNPNPITASRWVIRGSGWGATELRFTTGDNAMAFQVGTDADTCQRWTIEGIRFSNSLNQASLTGADPTIWIRNSVQGEVRDCAMVDNGCFIRLGNGATSQARRTFIKNNHLAPTMLANTALFDFQAFTVCDMVGNYAGASGTQPATARVFKIASTAGGDGCDGLYVTGGELNFNASDLDHAIEIVVTSLGASNLHFTGGCCDGGAVSNVLITLGSGAGGSQTKRLHNLTFTGMRLTCNTSGAAGPGRFMKIDSASDNLISGLSVVGCKIKGAGVLLGARTGGAADGFWDATFTGNSIINANDANGGNVFETDTGGLVITGNIVSHQDEDNANRFEYFLKTTGTGGKNVIVTGNNIKECSSATGFDLSSWTSTDLIEGTIRNNAGKPDPALRKITTTDATVTTIGSQSLTDGLTYRITGRVTAVRTDDSGRAAYTFDVIASAAAGTATVAAGGTPTVIFESNAAWALTVDANTSNVRIRVTGALSTTIDWGLYDVKVEAIG